MAALCSKLMSANKKPPRKHNSGLTPAYPKWQTPDPSGIVWFDKPPDDKTDRHSKNTLPINMA